VNGADVSVELANGEDGVSPGQACVFYDVGDGGERLLGGGWIKSARQPELLKDKAIRANAFHAAREPMVVGSR
jgi:tRNA-specific 2-thiouridylase